MLIVDQGRLSTLSSRSPLSIAAFQLTPTENVGGRTAEARPGNAGGGGPIPDFRAAGPLTMGDYAMAEEGSDCVL
jgi:hypothetical protein